ncbi:MAG: DNA gyrase inhibitor YacG [Acidobacteria bacterium]|nr:DNA gyrase inhibitor YacG [Acidobacteriota bacterium]
MREHSCPRCGRKTVYQGNPFRPFCSERCKLIDLGHWVSGDYRVPVLETEEKPPEKPGEEPGEP